MKVQNKDKKQHIRYWCPALGISLYIGMHNNTLYILGTNIHIVTTKNTTINLARLKLFMTREATL